MVMARGRVRRRAGLDRGRVRRRASACFQNRSLIRSYRSNNTFKIFTMERESFKEYPEPALVENDEL